MDTRNLLGVTSGLPASRMGIKYLWKGEWTDGGEGVMNWGIRRWTGSGLPKLSLTGRKATEEALTSRLYSVRVWCLTGRTGPFLCCSHVDHSMALP
ncbi:hypothetical protein EVAR_74123_1 [Eumeta japonica]|uniref:Uncharacterized protein n=1 Tax=Eumeta variegata TaxID=151549 RepID=A0A4C1TME6_EUMVA|nr:hypothetical protein EVAR_74123_1 [Eumeta japonica]